VITAGFAVRRLWLQGRRLGHSDWDRWKHIRAWAGYRPTAWEVEDRRKKKGLAHSAAELGDKLARELPWTSTSLPRLPTALNDAPSDSAITLLV